MRRLGIGRLILAGALAGLSAAVAGAPPAVAAVPAPPRAQLVRFSCQEALDPADRAIAVDAVMRPVPATEHLEIRFDLLRRIGRGAPVVLRDGDLGRWISPENPTLGQLPGDVWRLDKTVLNLAPAVYRFRVAFRWIGAGGRVLMTTARGTRTCTQRELRPDLLVKSLTVSAVAGDPAESLYSAVIANRGLTGAGPFEVLFAPGDGSGPSTRTVRFLGAHRSASLAFVGPSCDPASPPSVTVDAARQVDDYNRANNTLIADCAGTAAGP